MKAIILNRPKDFSIKDIDVPEIKEDEVLIRIKTSGICTNDVRDFNGDCSYSYPRIGGHEYCGVIEKMGSAVNKERFHEGQKVVQYIIDDCKECYFCKHGEENICEEHPKSKIFHNPEGKKIADEMGYPVMIKASAGGGGKGMRVCYSSDEFVHTFETAKLEAENAFGDGTMYIEKYIEDPRHIEFQILADKYGNAIHLGERDCSIQRRHQKIIEESPSPAIDEETRERMGKIAVKAAKAAGYYSAGTIEFLRDKHGEFYFIEMNTRIQVEHPVTEWVTGIDLIREQIRIAAGQPLTYSQDDIQVRGHAIEVRINAEDTEHDFRPSPGTVTNVHFPGGKGVRIDSALFAGYEIPPYYDSMVAKLIVYDKNRQLALRKLRNALGEVVLEGIKTNIDYQYEIINDPDFIAGNVDTGFIERFQKAREEKSEDE